MHSDTIAAIATALSPSGINIIRISGPDAFSVGKSVFRSAHEKDFDSFRNSSVNYGYIVSGEETIDEVLLLKLKGPHTFTCEDTVEIDCHGGVLVTKRVLETVLRNGARLAEPGEFTKRAFLNGRIDLSQAEAVIDLINAENDLCVKNSISQLKGSVKERISLLRERILSKTAYIEAVLDDPEHISLDGFTDELTQEIKAVISEINELISSSEDGRIIKEGIRTVILGAPNAGKSSLLNSLLGEERAIVTDIAGTTRDTLEEGLSLNGLHLNIIDTAGIHETQDVIEKIGVDKALKAAESADLILFVMDTSTGLTQDDIALLQSIGGHRSIVLCNKTDLLDDTSIDFESLKSSISKYTDAAVISISAKTGQGLDTLKKCISSFFDTGKISFNDKVYITNMRHKKLLCDALESLRIVLNSIDDGMSEDFLTIDLMDAYVSLGLITGENLEDDLADKIFSDFCMGK